MTFRKSLKLDSNKTRFRAVLCEDFLINSPREYEIKLTCRVDGNCRGIIPKVLEIARC